MEQEFETQVLDIDVDDIVKRLVNLGAEEKSEVLEKRWVYDIESADGDCSKWVRLRQSGDKTTICMKFKTDQKITGTREIEFVVDNFEKADQFLSELGFFFDRYYQENYKHNFYLNNLEFSIKRWPMIPPVLEIEGKSEEEVKKGLEMLGLAEKDNGHFGWKDIYKRYGFDLHTFKELKFDEGDI